MADMFEAHAETIISDLLEAVIEEIEPVMNLNKLEGDAAFSFRQDDGKGSKANDIIGAMELANQAFKKNLRAYVCASMRMRSMLSIREFKIKDCRAQRRV